MSYRNLETGFSLFFQVYKAKVKGVKAYLFWNVVQPVWNGVHANFAFIISYNFEFKLPSGASNITKEWSMFRGTKYKHVIKYLMQV